MKLHEAPTITVMAKGMPLTPKLPAITMEIGNIKTADATLVIMVFIKIHPINTTVRAVYGLLPPIMPTSRRSLQTAHCR